MTPDEIKKIIKWFEKNEGFWAFQLCWSIIMSFISGILWLGESLISWPVAVLIVIAPTILFALNAWVLRIRRSIND